VTTRSIYFRLIGWYAALLITVFVFLGALIYAGLRSYLVENQGLTQARRAQQMAETLLGNVDKTGEGPVVEEINSWVTPEINNRFVRITRGDSSVLYVSRNPRDGSFDASQVPKYPTPAPAMSWRTETAGDSPMVVAAVPCRSGSGKQFLVEVGVPLKSVHEILHRLVLLLGCGLAAMVVVSICSGYWLVKNALVPVVQISSSAERISLHNLSERLPVVNTGDELEHLSMSLNHMIVRLEDAVRHNQRFIADASHELRTPLTILNGELESILGENDLAPKPQQTISSALEELDRLRRIVECLFAISRLESGDVEEVWARFDLAELASSTAEQMSPLADDKGISLASEASGPAEVEADRARLKQVIVNLLDNAIKYTAKGGKVGLSVRKEDGHAVLAVSDNGIGIPIAQQKRIFERFFRVDSARSRDSGGAGLGLSIVKSICTAYGGKVGVESTEGAGSIFTVTLPLASSSGGSQNSTEHGNTK
jgi:heavy metal sensor kinase